MIRDDWDRLLRVRLKGCVVGGGGGGGGGESMCCERWWRKYVFYEELVMKGYDVSFYPMSMNIKTETTAKHFEGYT